MKDEYVRNWMTPNPVVINEDAVLPDAHELMKEYGVRRLPVVNKAGRLVGIVSQTDVREAEPSDATSLSIYELNYLLAKLKIKRIMTEQVITVTPDTTIAEAARIMLQKKIGGLPVLEDGQLVGIITESDIFRMVVKLYAE
jgi:CBS domain-containing protein